MSHTQALTGRLAAPALPVAVRAQARALCSTPPTAASAVAGLPLCAALPLHASHLPVRLPPPLPVRVLAPPSWTTLQTPHVAAYHNEAASYGFPPRRGPRGGNPLQLAAQQEASEALAATRQASAIYQDLLGKSLDSRDIEGAVYLLSSMLDSGVRPLARMFLRVIRATTEVGRIDLIDRLRGDMRRAGYPPNSFILSHMLFAYARAGCAPGVYSVFADLQRCGEALSDAVFQRLAYAFFCIEADDRALKILDMFRGAGGPAGILVEFLLANVGASAPGRARCDAAQRAAMARRVSLRLLHHLIITPAPSTPEVDAFLSHCVEQKRFRLIFRALPYAKLVQTASPLVLERILYLLCTRPQMVQLGNGAFFTSAASGAARGGSSEDSGEREARGSSDVLTPPVPMSTRDVWGAYLALEELAGGVVASPALAPQLLALHVPLLSVVFPQEFPAPVAGEGAGQDDGGVQAQAAKNAAAAANGAYSGDFDAVDVVEDEGGASVPALGPPEDDPSLDIEDQIAAAAAAAAHIRRTGSGASWAPSASPSSSPRPPFSVPTAGLLAPHLSAEPLAAPVPVPQSEVDAAWAAWHASPPSAVAPTATAGSGSSGSASALEADRLDAERAVRALGPLYGALQGLPHLAPPDATGAAEEGGYEGLEVAGEGGGSGGGEGASAGLAAASASGGAEVDLLLRYISGIYLHLDGMGHPVSDVCLLYVFNALACRRRTLAALQVAARLEERGVKLPDAQPFDALATALLTGGFPRPQAAYLIRRLAASLLPPRLYSIYSYYLEGLAWSPLTELLPVRKEAPPVSHAADAPPPWGNGAAAPAAEAAAHDATAPGLTVSASTAPTGSNEEGGDAYAKPAGPPRSRLPSRPPFLWALLSPPPLDLPLPLFKRLAQEKMLADSRIDANTRERALAALRTGSRFVLDQPEARLSKAAAAYGTPTGELGVPPPPPPHVSDVTAEEAEEDDGALLDGAEADAPADVDGVDGVAEEEEPLLEVGGGAAAGRAPRSVAPAPVSTAAAVIADDDSSSGGLTASELSSEEDDAEGGAASGARAAAAPALRRSGFTTAPTSRSTGARRAVPVALPSPAEWHTRFHAAASSTDEEESDREAAAEGQRGGRGGSGGGVRPRHPSPRGLR